MSDRVSLSELNVLTARALEFLKPILELKRGLELVVVDEGKLIAYETRKQELEAQIAGLEAELGEKLEDHRLRVDELGVEYTAVKDQLDSDIASAKQLLSDTKRLIVVTKEKHEEEKEVCRKLIVELEQQLDELRSEKGALERELAALDSQISKLISRTSLK